MTDLSAPIKSDPMDMHGHSPGAVLRSLVIGLTAFLTVVDLFATQAILPSLARHYHVTPAAMGFAVNASTMGMAIAGLVIGFLSPLIDRRLGILVSLTLLAAPTSLLANAWIAVSTNSVLLSRIFGSSCINVPFEFSSDFGTDLLQKKKPSDKSEGYLQLRRIVSFWF